jgi:hypothetical protein
MATGTVSGISAAWMEKDGLGELSVSGRVVMFRRNDGFTAYWSAGSDKEAKSQITVFRAATKYPQTRPAQ